MATSYVFTYLSPSDIDSISSLEPSYPRSLDALAAHINLPNFPAVLKQFIYRYDHPDMEEFPAVLPQFDRIIHVHHSATATYYSPSDGCGAGGLIRELIRSSPSYRHRLRRDTVFISTDPTKKGMDGMMVARVLLLFSFNYRRHDFSCALVHWYLPVGRDSDTTMWMVRPECHDNRGHLMLQVVPTDIIVCGAHLLPVYGQSRVPQRFDHFMALDTYKSFFVNHFIDHHTHKLIVG